MSIFGIIVAFTIVWWLAFFALLPLGVERSDEVEPGHDPGAPKRPLLWRKAIGATVVAILLVGAIWLVDHQGWVDFRSLIEGEGR